VQEKNEHAEQWTGYRLGTEGAKEKLGFATAFNGKEFLNSGIDYFSFDKVLFKDFEDDYRNDRRDPADLYDLVETFKTETGYYLEEGKEITSPANNELNTSNTLPTKKANLDSRTLRMAMAGLRQIKTEEEMKLLTKAIRISAMGQREIMKAMHPGMSETEVQGIHEYVYKKYGSEYEGYPSIVGAGNNACVLHYIDNSKMHVENDLVLMDLG